MCLAILKTADGKLPKGALREASKANGDGFGVAVATGDKLHLVRSMNLCDVEKTLERFGKFPALIHLRLATHGEKNVENCHPFLVDDSTAFIHNGVLTIPTPQKEKSDTWHFANLIVRPHQKESGNEWLWSGHASLSLHLLAGYSNKFAFLRADGKHLIVNESAGHWADGVWFSNSSYKPYVPYISSPYHRVKQSELGFGRCDADLLPTHYQRATQDEIVDIDTDEENLFGQFVEDSHNGSAWCEFLDTCGTRKEFKRWARDNPKAIDSFCRWMTDANEKGYYSWAKAYPIARKFYLQHWEQVEQDRFLDASEAENMGVPDFERVRPSIEEEIL